MGKFISFGKINKLYKYILIYVLIRFVTDYMFSNTFSEKIKPEIFKIHNYPRNIVVQLFLNYLATFISSIFLNFYLKSQNKSEVKSDKLQTESNILAKYELIYYIYDPGIKITSIFFPIIFSIISIELINVLTSVGFWGLFFWVFDLFLVAYNNLLVFDIPIYTHKKCAIAFILIFGTLFKFLSTYEYISNDKYNLFYKNHIIIIPFMAILYPILSLLRFYSLCKIKWLLDYKFIPVRMFFIIYNFLGMIILLIPCLISTFIKCVDKEVIHDINLICSVQLEKENNTEYYFDSFSYFFDQLWRKDRNTWMNILYLFLFIIQIFLNALRILYSILIIKKLNPEYYLCSFELYCCSIRFFGLIKALIEDEDIKLETFNILAETMSLIGILIYLELIELNFCNLNHNLKKYIEIRSEYEYNINDSLTETDEDN